MIHSALADPLNELATALIRMDHEAVAFCLSRLENAFEVHRGEPFERPEELRSTVQYCMTLARSASRFYAGWARVAALQGSAYTLTGAETLLNTSASLAVRG